MAISLSVWAAVFVFSLMIMLLVRDALALALMFSAVNAEVSVFFGFDLVISSCVFLASYAVLLAAILTANAAMNRFMEKRCVDNAQNQKR